MICTLLSKTLSNDTMESIGIGMSDDDNYHKDGEVCFHVNDIISAQFPNCGTVYVDLTDQRFFRIDPTSEQRKIIRDKFTE